MESVGIRELRQNLSRYIVRLKRGEAFAVTERGREVGRLVPAASDELVARLVAERGATPAQGKLLELIPPSPLQVHGPPSEQVIAELRDERP